MQGRVVGGGVYSDRWEERGGIWKGRGIVYTRAVLLSGHASQSREAAVFFVLFFLWGEVKFLSHLSCAL